MIKLKRDYLFQLYSGIIYFLFFFMISSSILFSQQSYFYTGKDYGSEAVYNPINLILNGSFDIIQLQNSNRDIGKIAYGNGAKNVFKNLGNPFDVIKRTGWNHFISEELFPVHLTKKGAQWWPNYQLHLIGGGMTFTAMKEWYSYHNFPSPYLMSLSTMAVYHILNEIVENGNYRGDNVDPIADLYVFDIGGIVLFSFDSVNKFFSSKLNLADWSLQPSFLLNDLSLQNNGQYFSIKWKIPFSEHLHVFYYFGMNGLMGLSYKFQNNSAVSFGAGLRNKELITVNQNSNIKTADLTWNFGIFYDRHNSLLSSLQISGLTDYRMDINIYPGLFKIGSFSPGLWCILSDQGKILLGFSTICVPGAGLRL